MSIKAGQGKEVGRLCEGEGEGGRTSPNDRLDRVQLSKLGFERGVPSDLAVHVLQLLRGVGCIGADQVEGRVLR